MRHPLGLPGGHDSLVSVTAGVGTRADAIRIAQAFVDRTDPQALTDVEYLRARFDAGLAWVHLPVGLGGLGVDPGAQADVDAVFVAAGAASKSLGANIVGLGTVAPVLVRFGTADQQRRWLRPLWTGEQTWCQLYREPDAGSDLAALDTSARRDGSSWIVNGRKGWISFADTARWGLLIARTDPSSPGHAGLTCFVCDMLTPGVEVRPLRQLTGGSEFSVVFLNDVSVPDDHRIGAVGKGGEIAGATSKTCGAGVLSREEGPIAPLLRLWRSGQVARTLTARDAVLRLWVKAENLRLLSSGVGQRRDGSSPCAARLGLELAYAELAQAASDLELDLLGPRGLLYDDWTNSRSTPADPNTKSAGYRFLRSRGDSIDGGSMENMRDIIAERLLKPATEPGPDITAFGEDVAP